VVGSLARGENQVIAMMTGGLVVVALGASLAGSKGVIKVRSRSRRGGFNCCEFCGEPLPRHPEQTWRYDGMCSACGRAQTWAPAAAKPDAAPS
jgi:hypothetical protein